MSSRPTRTPKPRLDILISDDEITMLFKIASDYETFSSELDSNKNQIFETILKFTKDVCRIISEYEPSRNLPLSQKDYLKKLRLFCLGGSQANANTNTIINSNRIQNKDVSLRLLGMFSTSTISRMLEKPGMNRGQIGDRLAYLDLLLHKQLKDVDPGKAITYFLREPRYVRNNVSKNRDFKKYIENMSKELNSMKNGKRKTKKQQVIKALEGLPDEYQELVKSIKVFYPKQKKVYGLRLKINNGPANHNGLSNRSLQNLLSVATENPRILNLLGDSSLFMAFLDNALKEHGGLARGKCGGFRGTIDKSLLRRRVVFKSAIPGINSSSLTALKRGLAAINHGRMHILKTLPNFGNKSVGVPRNMRVPNKYLNAMSSNTVRNSNFFAKNYNRFENTLFALQVDPSRHIPVRLTRDGSALEPFDPRTMTENKEVLWTSYGLQLNERSGGKFDFFDFIKYVYTGNKSGPSKIIRNVSGRGLTGGGKIFVIQMDSRTTEFLHEKYYYDSISNTDYAAQVKQILTSCNTGMNMDMNMNVNTPPITARPVTARPKTARVPLGVKSRGITKPKTARPIKKPKIKFTNEEYVRAAKIAWRIEILNNKSAVNNFENQNDRMRNLINNMVLYFSGFGKRANLTIPDYGKAIAFARINNIYKMRRMLNSKSASTSTAILTEGIRGAMEEFENN